MWIVKVIKYVCLFFYWNENTLDLQNVFFSSFFYVAKLKMNQKQIKLRLLLNCSANRKIHRKWRKICFCVFAFVYIERKCLFSLFVVFVCCFSVVLKRKTRKIINMFITFRTLSRATHFYLCAAQNHHRLILHIIFILTAIDLASLYRDEFVHTRKYWPNRL